MGAISRERRRQRAYLGDARARARMREGTRRTEGTDARARVCVHQRGRTLARARARAHARVRVCGPRCACRCRWTRGARKRGTGVGVCGEPEVQAGSRTAGASVRQRRHRFGLHAPIIGRLIGRYSATDSALHRFRGRPPSKSHAFSRECSAINGLTARAHRREARVSGKCIFRPAPRPGHRSVFLRGIPGAGPEACGDSSSRNWGILERGPWIAKPIADRGREARP
jgi:hypothetical protein